MTPEEFEALRQNVPAVTDGWPYYLMREMLIHIKYLMEDNNRLKEELEDLKKRLK